MRKVFLILILLFFSVTPVDAFTLVITGDIIPARSVNYMTLKKNDFTWAFKNIAPLLKKGDITWANLESPLIENCPVTNEGFVFCGDSRHIKGLRYSGIDIVNLANNHSGNYGPKGIDETVTLLKKNGITSVGQSTDPVYMTVKGKKMAFLGYNTIGVPAPSLESIVVAKKKTPLVIVQFHWGEEYTTQITDLQRDLAHEAIDKGAILVVGNHPHWVQPIEKYKGVPIVYAHGNTIFDQMWSDETRKGVIGTYTIEKNRVVAMKFTPTMIYEYGQPRLAVVDKQ